MATMYRLLPVLALLLLAASASAAGNRRVLQDVAAATVATATAKPVVPVAVSAADQGPDFTSIAGTAAAAAVPAQTSSACGKALFMGPSTKTTPYMLPADCDVTMASVLTVGDAVNKPDGSGKYRLVGIPDGMGAYPAYNDEKAIASTSTRRPIPGRFNLLVNHELGETVGIARAHGGTGAFISKWVIDSNTLEVISGEDLIKQVFMWDKTLKQYPATPTPNVVFSRFCSADLAPTSTWAWRGTVGPNRGDFGTKEVLFLTGEERGITGRAYATVATGKFAGNSYSLYNFGRDGFENWVGFPHGEIMTLVVGTDDGGTPHQAVYVYIGTKKFNPTGEMNPVEAAGLTDGKLYAIKIDGLPAEDIMTFPTQDSYKFSLVEVTPGLENDDPAAFQKFVNASGATNFARPEDAAWKPDVKTGELFVQTTANYTGVTKVWRFNWDSIKANPTAGGTVTVVKAASGVAATPRLATETRPVMLDNMAVNKKLVYSQEDPGNNDLLARIFEYDTTKPETPSRVVAIHDPARFGVTAPGVPGLLTKDEESSGIISLDGVMPNSRKGCYMVAQQAHYASTDPELVEGGQLLIMCTKQQQKKW